MQVKISYTFSSVLGTSPCSNPKHIKSVAEQTRGIIFLGTPHRGSSQASWGTMLARIFGPFKQTNAEIVSGLEKEAKQLNILQKRLVNFLDFRKETGNDVEITCFFEELPMPVIGTVGRNPYHDKCREHEQPST